MAPGPESLLLIYLTFSGLFSSESSDRVQRFLAFSNLIFLLGIHRTSYMESKIWEPHSNPGRHSIPFPLPACFAQLPYFWKLPSLDPKVATLGAYFHASSHLGCNQIPILWEAEPVGFLRCLGPSKPRDLLGQGSWNTRPPSRPPVPDTPTPRHCPGVTFLLYPDRCSRFPSPLNIFTYDLWNL